MTLSELCIRRPVMTTLLMVATVLLGLFGSLRRRRQPAPVPDGVS